MSGPRRSRWFRFRSRRDIDRDLEDEIGFHLERTVQELVRQGWSLPDAEREAYRRFGDVTRYRSRIRDLDERRVTVREHREWLASILHDLRHAARALRREPMLTVGIALTLALGIGANATMFGIVDRLLLSPPEHVREPESLRRLLIQRQWQGRTVHQDSFTYEDYRDLERVGGFESTGAYSREEVTLGFGQGSRRADAVVASASLIEMLGAVPARGRFFSAREDRLDGPHVAVLGWEHWRSRYAGDPDVLGKTITVAEVDYEIVGVAPWGFTGLDLARVDVWLPLHPAAAHLRPRVSLTETADDGWRIFWLKTIVRLRPGVSDAAVDEEATAIHLASRADRDDYDGRIVSAPIIAARGPQRSDEAEVSIWLTGVALVVLLVACANVTNMLLARGVRRRGELAVRTALGIQRSRLIRQLLSESVLLALLGGLAALLVGRLGGGLLRRVLLPDVAWQGIGLEPSQLALTLVVAMLAGLASGLLPALQWSRGDVVENLRAAGRGASGRSRVRAGLLVTQAALSVVLLIGAGLFLRSLQEVASLDMGPDDPGRVLLVSPERSTVARQDESFRWPVDDILHRIRRHPGVDEASAAITTPFGAGWVIGFSLPDGAWEDLPQAEAGGPYIHPVGAGFFEALGMDVLRGRGISERDREGSERVAVVNRTMAELYWPGEDPIGECVQLGRAAAEGDTVPCTTVVGVVEDARRQSIDEADTPQYYVPLEQHRLEEELTFVARLGPEADLAAVGADLGELILEQAPLAARHVSLESLQQRIDPHARAWRLGATMFTLFGVLAVVVAAIGLYGVLAFDVAQRRREIGIRAALGATRRGLRALVVRQGVALTAIGTTLGVLVALVAGPRLEELLFRVSPRDPLVLAGVAGLWLVVAVASSWLPALRATRVDPNEALRAE